MRTRLRLAVLTIALFSTSVFAGGRDDLTTFTKGLKGLDGTFTQQVFDANGKKWIRFAVWDSAGDGAYTQPVALSSPALTAANR